MKRILPFFFYFTLLIACTPAQPGTPAAAPTPFVQATATPAWSATPPMPAKVKTTRAPETDVHELDTQDQKGGETPAVSLSPDLTATMVQTGPYTSETGLAIADLAQRLGIDEAEIKVVQEMADEFPAGDLGCPAPGDPVKPIPAFVSGKSIILQAQGERYLYHARRQMARFCGVQ